MKIGIDIMGGDFAPEVTIHGAILAYNELPREDTIVLIGNETIIRELLSKHQIDSENFEIVHAPETIGMGEHPAKAYSKKKNSSINIGFNLLKAGLIDGFASSGNTGAMMVGTMYSVKSIPGVIRPCITTSLPNEDGSFTIVLDVGINPDCRPDVLYQYAILGKLYAEHVHSIKNPKIGLLNVGEEEEKGSLLTKATYELMKDSEDFNFIGNVEGNEIFTPKADVIVCDGLTGNVVLKQTEGFYSILKRRNKLDNFFEKLNFEQYGGTPILGVNGVVFIGHGISNENAIKNMIIHTGEVIQRNLINKIKEVFI